MDFYKGRTVLVTGHKGFIGSHLSRRLAAYGANVVGLDRDKRDVKNRYQVSSLFAECDPSVVFHLAAATEVRASYDDPLGTWRTNVMGTLNVLEECRKRRVKALVVASTDKVYGDQYDWGGACKEDAQLLHNADIYASSKRAADELAQDYARVYGLPIRILRCANVYGPGQRNETTLITGTITKVLRGEMPVVHADARYSLREWLYIDDAVEAYLLAGADAASLPRNGDPYPSVHPAFNVGSREIYSVDAVVRKVLVAMGKDLLNYELVADTRPQIGNQGLESYKFRRRFPSWTTVWLDEGLARTVAWHKDGCK